MIITQLLHLNDVCNMHIELSLSLGNFCIHLDKWQGHDCIKRGQQKQWTS